MKKIYVLDTNILLSDPNAIYLFGDNDILIPTVVLQELDSKKKLMDEVGRNARYISRQIDKLREKGKLHEGIELVTGGIISTTQAPPASEVYTTFNDDSNDSKIIATALFAKEINKDKEVVLVSKDVLVRVKADMFLQAEDYLNDKVISTSEAGYKGLTHLEVDSEDIDVFYSEKKLISPEKFPPNHFILLKSGNKSALTMFKDGYLHPLYNYDEKESTFGLFAKNVEQKFALELLLNPDIPLVTMSAKAGTGKTLLALASALKQTVDLNKYKKVLAARPVVPMGKDIGYLPGEKDEKLRPWMQPIYDNLEFLFNAKTSSELDNILTGYEDIIEIEALTYIRGRSIPEQFIIIDEAQNLTKHEVKTILTRVGEKGKIVLLGDPQQIDHPYLDAFSNGLTYVIEKMKDQKIAGHISLVKGERSDLAQLCADIL
jgi:PhoH-like ATPase